MRVEILALMILLVPVLSCAGAGVESQEAGDVIHVTWKEQPFASVHLQAEPRPFIHPLYGPGGIALTRGYPMLEGVAGEAEDHPHHQSFWFAHGDVNGFDFWHGKGHDERMVWNGDYAIDNSSESCRIKSGYDWTVDESTVICTEQRELSFAGDGDTRTIDVVVTLTAGSEPLVLGDTKEGSFALRLHPALRVEGEVATGTLINSEGQSGKDAWGKRARWIDDSGTIDGQEVGVAIFDHPSNHAHPTWWHARTYGLVAANPFGVHDFERKPEKTGELVVPAGGSLRLEYRVLLHGADWDHERLESAYRGWIED